MLCQTSPSQTRRCCVEPRGPKSPWSHYWSSEIHTIRRPAGNRLQGEHLYLPGAVNKNTPIKPLMHLSAQDWNKIKKGLLNNKSWMNMFFVIYEHGLLQEQQIKMDDRTVVKSIWFRAFASSQKETSASPPAPHYKHSSSRGVGKPCQTKITSVPETLPSWEQRCSKSIWVSTLTHVYKKRLRHFQSVHVII